MVKENVIVGLYIRIIIIIIMIIMIIIIIIISFIFYFEAIFIILNYK